MDVAERAEAQIETFISRMDTKRRDSEGERAEEALWVDSTRRHAAKLREAARAEWTLYHEHLARLHRALADEHQIKAEKLMQEGETA